MPFANTSKGEYGTYFIGYASTFSTTRQSLSESSHLDCFVAIH